MAINPQSNVIPASYHMSIDANGNQAAIRTDGAQAMTTGALNTTLNITAATAVKATSGRVTRACVTVAGSTAGTINDCATTGAAAAANAVAAIPNTVGVYYIDWPFATGIVVVPGTGMTVAINWD